MHQQHVYRFDNNIFVYNLGSGHRSSNYRAHPGQPGTQHETPHVQGSRSHRTLHELPLSHRGLPHGEGGGCDKTYGGRDEEESVAEETQAPEDDES